MSSVKTHSTILIFAYYSFKDPVFQSAVLPYFNGLSRESPGLRFILLTFEQKKFLLDKATVIRVEEELREHNITWFRASWNSGSFKLVKKAYDILQSIVLSSYLLVRFKVDKIYSEGFPGAVLSHWLAKIFRKDHIVHTFEPHTQYMIEAGVWNEGSWEAKMLSKYEIKVAKGATHLLTATDAMVQRLGKMKLKAQVLRVPSCVDMDTFRYQPGERIRIRAQLNVKDDEVMIVYLGKFGGMYMEEEIFEFYKVCEEYPRLKFKYLVLTIEEKGKVLDLIDRYSLPKNKFFIKKVSRSEVSSYLSSSDFGFVAVRQFPGKRFCSPIKDGEYWACGLPVIIPKGISDDYIYASQHEIGIVMKDTTKESFTRVCEEMLEWRSKDKEEVVERCRDFVKSDRDISLFKPMYRNIFLPGKA